MSQESSKLDLSVTAFLRKSAPNEFGKRSTSFRNLFKKALVSLSKLFADYLSSSEQICLHVWSRIMTLWEKRTSALKLGSVQISNVEHSTLLSVIYHFEWTWTLWSRHEQKFSWEFSFNETFWPELTSPWGGHHSKSLTADKLTRGLSFSGLSFPFHELLLQRLRAGCFL